MKNPAIKSPVAWLAVGTALIIALPLGLWAAQNTGSNRDRAVVVGDTAYLIETPAPMVPATVVEQSVSADGRYLIAVSENPMERQATSAKHTLTLFLYDTRTQRTRTLRTWSGDTQTPSQTRWLADSDTAVVTLYFAPEPSEPDAPPEPGKTRLFLVHCGRQTVQSVLVGDGEISIDPSPTRPEALLTVTDTATKTDSLRLLSASAVVGAPIASGVRLYGTRGWNESGDSALFVGNRLSNELNREIKHVYLVWNRQKGTLTEQPAKSDVKAFSWRGWEHDAPDFPLRFLSDRGTITTNRGATGFLPCAVLEGTDAKERILIATNADAVTIMGKPASPTLVYRQGDALFAVPVRTNTLAEYTENLHEQAQTSAKQIALAISMYRQDYDEEYPLKSHNVAKDIVPYLKSEELFRDPRTGANAFTYTYTGSTDKDGNTALFTFQTTVGAFRAFVNGNGEAIVEPITPPTPSAKKVSP